MLIADYWILRKRELNLEDLYVPDGEYRGWSWKAIGATVLGCALAWSGLFVPALRTLYDYAWFVGFLTAGVTYLALMLSAKPRLSYSAGPARRLS